MAGIFTKRNWQPCICQPNELKREIRKKTGGAKQKSGEAMAHPGPSLESPLGGTTGQLPPPKFSKTFLVVRYNNQLTIILLSPILSPGCCPATKHRYSRLNA